MDGIGIGVFREILFAIVDDHNARRTHNPEGNFKPFVGTFCLLR